MNNRSHRWELSEVVQETKDTISIYFNTYGQDFDYQPGQFINISLPINGEVVSRSYSLSSSPNEKYPSITVKRVAGGIMSNYLLDNANTIREWGIEGPFGNFTLAEPTEVDKYCFLGGGSGITPLFSMMKFLKGKAGDLHLLYANRNEEDIIFRTTIEKLINEGTAKVFHSLTGEFSADAFGEDLFKGRLNKLIVKKVIKQWFENPLAVNYYICGPEKLMAVYKEALLSLGVPETQIFSENFSLDSSKGDELILPEEPHEVLIHAYGSTSLIDVKAGQTILESAIENGVPIKYSCKNGTCGSCWGTYSEGTVNMVKNYALTKEEVDNKYILLCQAYPMDEAVTVHVG